MMQNFERELVGPCSVGVRIGALFAPIKGKPVDLAKGDLPKMRELTLSHTLRPGELVIARSMERFSIAHNMCVLHLHNSTAMRAGLEVHGGLGEPGYEGEIFFSIRNASPNAMILKKGLSITKVLLLPVEGRTVPLLSRYQGGKLL